MQGKPQEDPADQRPTLAKALYDAGRAYCFRVLSQTGGDVRKAAKIAGVHRVTMYRTLAKYGIQIVVRKSIRTE